MFCVLLKNLANYMMIWNEGASVSGSWGVCMVLKIRRGKAFSDFHLASNLLGLNTVAVPL